MIGKRCARALLVAAMPALILAACGGQSTGAGATGSPSSSPSATPTAPVASPIVLAQVVGSMGTLLVASSNGHTLYTFKSDTPGVSNCKGGCVSAWPPLSLTPGTAPVGGAGVTGQLGTITRDDGSLQVAYKGLPLYFFHSDSKPGDTNGNYTGWSLVKP
jgi:predicted lipoprotein with Yx(FWY)xxD motif